MKSDFPWRIGLYGGSFDPVHDTHVSIAQTALDALKLDELWWIPAGTPPQKTRQPAPAADRAAMIALAIAGEPRFRLERCELDRSGVSYTLDTVEALQQRVPDAEWFLLLGADQCANLPTWRGWQALVGRVNLVVADRLGSQAPCVSAFGADICNPAPDAKTLDPSAGATVRVAAAGQQACHPALERQLLRAGRQLRHLAVTPTATSSTAVRAAVAAGGDIGHMVPLAVQRYIAEHRLYNPPNAPASVPSAIQELNGHS